MTQSPMPRALTNLECEALIRAHPAWHLVRSRKAVSRYFRCSGFAEAFGLLNAIAIVAEKANHHPELTNVFDRVEVVLTTHDVHGLSRKDVDLVGHIDRIARQFGPACDRRSVGSAHFTAFGTGPQYKTTGELPFSIV